MDKQPAALIVKFVIAGSILRNLLFAIYAVVFKTEYYFDIGTLFFSIIFLAIAGSAASWLVSDKKIKGVRLWPYAVVLLCLIMALTDSVLFTLIRFPDTAKFIPYYMLQSGVQWLIAAGIAAWLAMNLPDKIQLKSKEKIQSKKDRNIIDL